MNTEPQNNYYHWLVIAAFLILFAPLALNFNFYYPDEVHYSDAAIEMLNNGDYLTPYQGSGELRFNKPILTYWFVLLGFKLFGISAFATRFFFYLAGAIILLIVYRIGNLIYSKHKTALIAMAITATHATFLMSSMRSIPDILLCLFMTVSALGFAGLIKFGNESPSKYKWMLYLGLAFAFEVKGIPAVLLGAAGLAFLILNPWQQIHWKKLFHWPSLLTALIIALFWFVIMFVKYGQEFTQSFYNDQVGERITVNLQSILTNVVLSVLLIIGLFIPWISFISGPFRLQQKQKDTKFVFQAFVITWTVTAILLSGMVFKFYERYLLPVIPVCAIFLAHHISNNIEHKLKLFKLWSITLAIINLVFLAFSVILYFNFNNSLLDYMWLTVASLITILIFFNLFRAKNPVWLAVSILIITFQISIITHKISFPTEGQQIAQIIKNKSIDSHAKIAFIGDPQNASKLRIECKNEYKVVNLKELYTNEGLQYYEILIASENNMERIPMNSFDDLGTSVTWNSSESARFLLGILKGNYSHQLQLYGKKYHVLKRKPGT